MPIHLWSYKKVGEELRDDTLHIAHKILSFIVFGLGIFWWIHNTNFAYDATGSTIGLIVWLMTIVIPYYVNYNADNKNFILRYVSLYLPLTVRVVLFAVIYMIIMGIMMGLAGVDVSSINKDGQPPKLLELPLVFAVAVYAMVIPITAYSIYIVIQGIKIASSNSPAKTEIEVL